MKLKILEDGDLLMAHLIHKFHDDWLSRSFNSGTVLSTLLGIIREKKSPKPALKYSFVYLDPN